ncbi:hypothetical protein [Wolbachia endosymbiont of Atemnus politus]|uniref:hypothetical protein n=1 Tax=Wolbachia endosymbiont of Atemnus politus TaxID=2682840 RepID=UPI001FEB2E28|nr:hypothetical protein [Wolbachia endosymbiont of Atemnus politus]
MAIDADAQKNMAIVTELSGRNKYVKDNKQAINSNIFPSSDISYSYLYNDITNNELGVKVLI